MRPDEIRRIERMAQESCLVPLSKQKKEPKNHAVFGFDTEFTDKEILSFSLSYPTTTNEIKSRLVYVHRAELDGDLIYQTIRKIIASEDVPSWYREVRVYYLIAHFSQADISRITYFMPRMLLTDVHTRLLEVSGTYIGGYKPTSKHTIKILDTFTFFKGSLEKIGKILGFKKLEVSKEHKQHMDVFARLYPEQFEAYANRDAEITLRAFQELQAIAEPYGVSPVRYPTASSLAGGIFRRNFLSQATTKVQCVGKNQRWVYADNSRVRQMALRSYWGGRNEQYFYGKAQGHFSLYDVKSLYPHAAILQPLPNAMTSWTFLSQDTPNILSYEGFVTVKFSFLPMDNYPCLPVHDGTYLLFPRQGISHCTIAELRAAHQQKCVWQVIQGYGFLPTDNERKHDLQNFFHFFNGIKNKTNKEENPFLYEFTKLVMNSLIGKFVQRKQVTDYLSVSRRTQVPLDELHDVVSSDIDEAIEDCTKIHLGSLFCPEWASLILGNARALMAEIVAVNKPYMAVTDSIMIDHPLYHCTALDRLASVGSGMALEHTCSLAYLSRLRCYWLFDYRSACCYDGQLCRLLTEDAKPLLWLVKKAVHGMGVSKKDDTLDKEVLSHILWNTPLPEIVHRDKLVRFKESFRRRLLWNSQVSVPTRTSWKPDRKRQLAGEQGWSEPYACCPTPEPKLNN